MSVQMTVKVVENPFSFKKFDWGKKLCSLEVFITLPTKVLKNQKRQEKQKWLMKKAITGCWPWFDI